MNGRSFLERGSGETAEGPCCICYTGLLDEKYVHEQHPVHHIRYHILFCPKRRRKVLVGPLHDRLQQMSEQIAEEHAWQMVELAIRPDHVHLFMQTNPYTMPTEIARLIKGRSSHLLREEYPHVKRMPSLCGTRIKKSLSVRTHICPGCGLVLDRDHNAAINIEARA